MGKAKGLVLLMVAILVFGLACQDTPNLVEPQVPEVPGLAAFGIPPGATFVSASFNVYVNSPSGNEITVHRITAPWDENIVTWNSFGGAYDPTVVGTFVANGGWQTVNVTSLVEGWLNGTIDNYGLLIDQGVGSPLTQYWSKEFVEKWPYLEICYTLDGALTCEQIVTNGDTNILEFAPDENRGWAYILYTGWATDTPSIKQALFMFDLEVTVEPAAIGDFVWYDDNMNGIQDAGEAGAPDVTVNLLDCAGNVLATMLTDANGYYLFSNLTPGDYLIQFVAPEGYHFTLQDQGSDDAVDSDADVTTGLAWCTTLDAGETDLTWDAGLYLIPMEGCTLTIGFWKTHAGFGPQPDLVTQYLPIWLGNAGGTYSLNVVDAQTAVNVLSMFTYGKPSNGITKLYAQLLGAKLNIANGADYSAVSDVIDAADDYLADHSWTEWDGLSKSTQKMIIGWMSSLDDYNNGDIGPGHCD